MSVTADPIDPNLSVTAARELPATQARNRLPELIEEVRDGGVVYLTRYGRRVAALVPADVAESVERMEDDYWARRAMDALRSGESPISWEQALAELGEIPSPDPR